MFVFVILFIYLSTGSAQKTLIPRPELDLQISTRRENPYKNFSQSTEVIFETNATRKRKESLMRNSEQMQGNQGSVVSRNASTNELKSNGTKFNSETTSFKTIVPLSADTPSNSAAAAAETSDPKVQPLEMADSLENRAIFSAPCPKGSVRVAMLGRCVKPD